MLHSYQNVKFSIFQVKAEDRDKKGTCKCTNDPHITTLDGRCVYVITIKQRSIP